MNNKTHSMTKVSLFMVNYGRELRMEVDIRRKEKVEKVMKFAERVKKIQKEVVVALKKVQKEIKQQAERKQSNAEYKELGVQ